MTLVHWDDVGARRGEAGHIAGTWRDLGRAAETVGAGVKRIEVDPGRWSTPAHVESVDEEIFFVLAGSGLSWQDGRTYEVRAGDCIVHLPGAEAHTLRAGDGGLDVLAFGTRVAETGSYLPRAKVAWAAGAWTEAGLEPGPWQREAAVGEPETPGAEPRPRTIVNLDEVDPDDWEQRDMGGSVRALGAAAGSRRTGLNHEVVPPGKLNTAPHYHSAEEEIFVVLDGGGTLLLGDAEHEVRRGHVLGKPPGTKLAHAFRGGAEGLTLLSYGTREPNDMTFYPRSGVFALRGIGILGRLEPVSGEDVW